VGIGVSRYMSLVTMVSNFEPLYVPLALAQRRLSCAAHEH